MPDVEARLTALANYKQPRLLEKTLADWTV